MQIATFGGFLFIVPVFLQTIAHLDAFTTALLTLPMALILMVVSFLGPRLVNYIHPKYILVIGFLIAGLSTFILRGDFTVNIHPINILPGLMLYGVAGGLLLSQLTNYIMSSVGDDEQADASGILNVFKNLGRSIGVSLVGVLLLAGMFGGITSDIMSSDLGANKTADEIHKNFIKFCNVISDENEN